MLLTPLHWFNLVDLINLPSSPLNPRPLRGRTRVSSSNPRWRNALKDIFVEEPPKIADCCKQTPIQHTIHISIVLYDILAEMSHKC
jgi:hypothetical protein